VGGAPGLCLDSADVRQAAGQFLGALVTRYRDHPGLGGYDVWNECNYGYDTCYCPATAAKFRTWLRARYGDLRALSEAWRRYGLAEWEDVVPPRSLGPYPDTLDWLQFRIDNAYDALRWRVQLIRSLDEQHAITAHGIAGSLTRMAPGGADDWRAAAEVDSYGYTWGSSRHGDEPWKQFHAADLVRSSARGKPFWHAEAYAGPLWMQPNVLDKPRDEGRIASPEDVRYWDLVSFMCGARGLFYLRWRPLLDGPLFGAFGPYGLDGSRTDRSAMAGRVARWVGAPEQDRLWQARPVRGEVGIVYVPETQLFVYAQQGNTDHYASSMQGTYRAFFDQNLQADWVHIEDVAHGRCDYRVLYLPFPLMLSQATANTLRSWVAGGGMLVAEGCPGYFGNLGHVGTVQPNLGLDELFGVRESYVEFTPDLLNDLRLYVNGRPVWGGILKQAYEATAGTPVGWYGDGRPAAVDNRFGKGRTRLVGTMAGAGYAAHPEDPSVKFFADVVRWAGVEPGVVCSDPRIKARLHVGAGEAYLWVANPARQPIPVRLTLGSEWGPFASARSLWGAEAEVAGRTVTLVAEPRDVAVIALS
jgi:beta-galactosidase